MNYFMKNLKNEIALASTKILMRSYTSATRDSVILTFTQTDQCRKSTQDWSLDSFSVSDGWLDGWKIAYTIKERWTVCDAGDVAEERSFLGWRDHRNKRQSAHQKIFGAWTSLVIFSKYYLIKGNKQNVAKRQSKDSRLPFRLMLPQKKSTSQLLYERVAPMASDVTLAVLKRFNWKLLFEKKALREKCPNT